MKKIILTIERMSYYVLQLQDGFIRPAKRGRHAIARHPQDSDYYRCVEDYFETFIQIYDEQFSQQYGFWRPYVEQVIYRYLDCGDLHSGFAPVKLVLDLIGDAKIAATNIYSHFPASVATSALPAIRSGWWNSGNGSAWTSLRRFHTGILFSVSRRFSAGIFSTTGSFLQPLAAAPGNH